MAKAEEEEVAQMTQKISRVVNETQGSTATHPRKLKELSAIRSSAPHPQFSTAFFRSIVPLFSFQRRTAASERTVRFVATFASSRDPANASQCDVFLEDFMRFLVPATAAANKTARFRACQIISEIIMRLPDNAEVSNDLWDQVIEYMKKRVEDKIPIIRTFAVRALSRFANDSENSDILELFLQALSGEPSADVRKTVVLSLPPSQVTSTAVIDCTLDVNETVRRAAYIVLANKFPLQSLSIKHRNIILQRGLADRSVVVTKECLRLLTDEWLMECCNGDSIELLKYLDVETYETTGQSVMVALLKSGSVKVQDGESIRAFVSSGGSQGEAGCCTSHIQLMEPEVALYWRTICQNLQIEAEAKGSDAAATTGTEAAVYAAAASDINDILERILPETVSDYIKLVKAHLNAGPNHRFASRQLLLLGAMLDFSDATNRKVASVFVQELLRRPLDHEVDDDGNTIVIGDGMNLGGDRDWANAVSDLAKKVYAAASEFEESVLAVVRDLAQPCRERTADFLWWMHCLSVTGLLLENAKSYCWVPGKLIELAELLQSLLLPGAKHAHLDVQRVAVRCLGLFGLLEMKPSEDLVNQLKISFVKGPSSTNVEACKALIDLGMWHGFQQVDSLIRRDSLLRFSDKTDFSPIDWSVTEGDMNFYLLDILYAALDRKDWEMSVDIDGNESIHSVIGEGFAKILLLSVNYPSIPFSLHPLLLAKLICLYFSKETKNMHRLKQCLSVFFGHYPSLSANHKKCLSAAFIPVMRSMWPGIDGNIGGAPVTVSTMRKCALQASQFMLQMMQAPLYQRETRAENGSKELPETADSIVQSSFESGEEGLAIRIAAEVASFSSKKTAAEQSYVIALCKIMVLLHFRQSETTAIKLMRRLLSRVAESLLTEKEIMKELKRMAECLESIDFHPDEELPRDEANFCFGMLGIVYNLDRDGSMGMPPTPAPRSTNPARSRRRIRHEESSDEESSPTSTVPAIVSTIGFSQRASKTAALSKIAASTAVKINDGGDSQEECSASDVTSEDDSDESTFSDQCLV